MSLAIKTQGLLKRFKDIIAVDHIDLSVAQGQIFGLLGPNAAGKSTTIRLVSGLLSPDAGDIEILGLDLMEKSKEIKQRIGYVAQHFALYPELTVRENLDFFAAIYGNTEYDFEKLLDQYGLLPYADKRAGNLSGGYKRRLSIACAVSHDPELLFLDEPTAGIDPVTRKELWDLFYQLAAVGKTLFVTTHYMEEAERCNELAFIHQGSLVAQDTPEGIKNSLTDTVVLSCNIPFDPELSKKLIRVDGVKVLNQFGDELRIIVDKGLSVSVLQDVIVQTRKEQCELQEASPRIEDVFMSLTHTETMQ